MTLLRPMLALVLLLSLRPVMAMEEPSERLTFEHDIRPILKAYCLDCHGGEEELKGGLDLRLKRFAEAGGRSGTALFPGFPDESLLLIRMQDAEMPPGEVKVPPESIALIEQWIAAGAPTDREEPESIPPGIGITAEERSYWAFQPIRRHEPPAFGPEDRVRTPIDAFVLSRLQALGDAFAFAPDSDRLTLIRRASADLTGLPPTSEQIDFYLNDSEPGAYDRMIDRLLDSPSYGERWARHWLDVAGYADSDGNGSQDTPRAFAYKYRDYVIRAFNADKPLDQFIIEQLAGDELVPKPWANLTTDQQETLAATGFLRTVADPTSTGGGDLALDANQVVADTLKVVGSSMLGLTVGCAQCHDHRYDPIPQADYFRLRAVFEPALNPQQWRRPSQRLVSLFTEEERTRSQVIEAEAQKLQAAVDAKTQAFIAAAFDVELQKFPEDRRAALRDAFETPADQRSEDQKALLAANPSLNITAGNLYQYNPKAADELKADREQIAAKRSEKPVEDFIAVLDEIPDVRPETRLFHRGDHRQPLDPVSPGDLTVLAPEGERFEIPDNDPTVPSSGRRLAYARHLVSGKHPLVGRVLANRIWMHHFGRGLVETPGDFGFLGQLPSHPELLDWLATELVRQGWSLKAMHRLIMTSTVYRQSSRHNPELDLVDSSNIYYGRSPVRRLDAEILRDRILAASGRLDLTPFGPSIPAVEGTFGEAIPEGNSTRRSIYVEVRRSRPISFLTAFDAPLMDVNCERRTLSTSAPQALMLMNSPFVVSEAEAMADRLIAETPADFATDQVEAASWNDSDTFRGEQGATMAQMIAYAWSLAYQRSISPEELDLAREFVTAQRAVIGPEQVESGPERAVLANLCHQLLSSNEFLYVD
ncbi:PSD1 and planctomycete cytochrome C domain-containing protein [Tautonia marina]|uniref:PSD1 and planctomycete cytochrome C domain-containing protein n=1 Tax=Tautonia marina TaxID=2653855 RepID=UPI00126100E2|nr:PSD1 and planctomycete cytochrome C domain-containing protein [Tautonia marina]